MDNVRYIWTLVQIITQFVIGVTFPLATTYDPALNGEPLTGFHSTWQTVLKIWTRLFWIGQDKAIEVAIYTHKKNHRNLTGTKVWANNTFLFLWLTVWPEYQAFLGGKGKWKRKREKSPLPQPLRKAWYSGYLKFWAQLFEGRLPRNPRLNLTQFLFLVFKRIFSDNFLCYF